MSAAVVVVGSFNVDHVWQCESLPAPGATLSGRYSSGPGGKGFNQAVAAARAGARTAFVCALGDDAGADRARALAAEEGIDLRALVSAQPTGTAGIYVDAAGRNSIVIGAGANADLSTEFVAHQQSAFASPAVVLAQLESPADAVAHALRWARASGALAMLNPAPANAATTPLLLDTVDILTPNETEFAALIARHVGERFDPGEIAALDQNRLHALCRELLRGGSVVITLGASGCFVSHAEERLQGDTLACYRIAAEPARAVDTTGAGDAFNGALAAARAAAPTRAFADAVRFASLYAARSTEQHGAAAAMPYLRAPTDG